MPTMNPIRKSKPTDVGTIIPTGSNPELPEITTIRPSVIGSTNVGTIVPSSGRRHFVGENTAGVFEGGNIGRGMEGSHIVTEHALNTDQSYGSSQSMFDQSSAVTSVLQSANPEELAALSTAVESYLTVNSDDLKSAGGAKSIPLSRKTDSSRGNQMDTKDSPKQQPTFLTPKASLRPNSSSSPIGSTASLDSQKLHGMNASKSSPASVSEHMFHWSDDEQMSPLEVNKAKDKFSFDVEDAGIDLSGRKRNRSEVQNKPPLEVDEEEQRSLSYQDLRMKPADPGEDCLDGLSEDMVKAAQKAGRKTSFSKLLSKSKSKVKSSMEDISAFGSLPRSETDSGFFNSLSRTFSKSFGKGKKTKTIPANLNEYAVSKNILTERILNYPKRENALLLIISMFRGELKGYMIDHPDVVQFFGNKLGYTCLEYQDCTQAELFQAFADTKATIKKLYAQGKKVTRLAVAILTHGEEEGIHTCADDQPRGFMRETEADGVTAKVTTLESIINKFKHDADNIPELKGIPKFFMIQACHGEEIVKSAGLRRSKMPVEQADGGGDELDDFTYQTNLPVDADFLVVSAATKYNRSFVSDQKGSWLIQIMLQVFRNMYQRTDVEMMLKAVTLAVSEERKGITYQGGKQEVAVQCPSRQSTLRKIFYL